MQTKQLLPRRSARRTESFARPTRTRKLPTLCSSLSALRGRYQVSAQQDGFDHPVQLLRTGGRCEGRQPLTMSVEFPARRTFCQVPCLPRARASNQSSRSRLRTPGKSGTLAATAYSLHGPRPKASCPSFNRSSIASKQPCSPAPSATRAAGNASSMHWPREVQERQCDLRQISAASPACMVR